MSDRDFDPDHIPMPVHAEVVGTLRNRSPVARIAFTDVVGDVQEIDLAPDVAIRLVRDLAGFVAQVGL